MNHHLMCSVLDGCIFGYLGDEQPSQDPHRHVRWSGKICTVLLAVTLASSLSR